jgi:hypothetical protein
LEAANTPDGAAKIGILAWVQVVLDNAIGGLAEAQFLKDQEAAAAEWERQQEGT